jgi:hypothetical protein
LGNTKNYIKNEQLDGFNETHYVVQNIPKYICAQEDLSNSSLNVFDDGAVLLLFKFWTFSIISLFLELQRFEGLLFPRP